MKQKGRLHREDDPFFCCSLLVSAAVIHIVPAAVVCFIPAAILRLVLPGIPAAVLAGIAAGIPGTVLSESTESEVWQFLLLSISL